MACLGAACTPPRSPQRGRRCFFLYSISSARPAVSNSGVIHRLAPILRRPSRSGSLIHRAPSVCARLSRLPQPTFVGEPMRSSYAAESSACGCIAAKHRSSQLGPPQEPTSFTLPLSECNHHRTRGRVFQLPPALWASHQMDPAFRCKSLHAVCVSTGASREMLAHKVLLQFEMSSMCSCCCCGINMSSSSVFCRRLGTEK